MIVYSYKAKDMEGQNHIGTIESSDPHTVALTLRKKGLVVVSITSKSQSATDVINKFLNKVSFTSVVIVTRQLATMVGAGLVLSEAIDILEEQQENKTLKKAFLEISQDIKGGLTLAQALSKHSDIFPKLYINLVRSGETAGKLDQILVQMADSLEKDREFQAKVKGAMIYPVVVLSMMVAVVIIMMVFVIPKLLTLYSQSTIELPLPTKILIFTSNMFVNYWWLMIALAIGGFIALKKWNNTPSGNLLLGKIILKTPLVGKIVTNVTLTNFNRTFGLLVSAGIPLLEAIGIVTDLMDNPVYKKSLQEAYTGVERGLPFSSLLTGKVYPHIISQMVRVGEETGKVDEIFIKLANYFESESDHLVKNLTVAIEPIVLVVLGIGVAFLVISIILPIYKLTTSF